MYFTYFNFPPVPKDLEKEILHIAENPTINFQNTNEFVDHKEKNRSDLNIMADEAVLEAISSVKIDLSNSLGFPLKDAWERFKDLAQFDFLEVNEEIERWARKTIDNNLVHVSIQVMHGGTRITPHVDEMRKKAYNYIVSTGGEAKTCFYKPKDRYKNYTVYPQTVFPLDRLDLVKKIQIQPYKWHGLKVDEIHSVEDLDPKLKRVSLSLSFL